jgi:hypothetical protein
VSNAAGAGGIFAASATAAAAVGAVAAGARAGAGTAGTAAAARGAASTAAHAARTTETRRRRHRARFGASRGSSRALPPAGWCSPLFSLAPSLSYQPPPPGRTPVGGSPRWRGLCVSLFSPVFSMHERGWQSGAASWRPLPRCLRTRRRARCWTAFEQPLMPTALCRAAMACGSTSTGCGLRGSFHF